MKQRTVEDTKPWYRQFWPWFVVGIPLITIVWCIFMITVAVSTENSMVNDDYYKKGLAINQELGRDRKAAELGLSAEVLFTDDVIRVEMSGQDQTDPYAFVMLNLFHPTLSGKDQRLKLLHQGDGIYQSRIGNELTGRWYLEVRGPANNWRLKGEAGLPVSDELPLRPAIQG